MDCGKASMAAGQAPCATNTDRGSLVDWCFIKNYASTEFPL